MATQKPQYCFISWTYGNGAANSAELHVGEYQHLWRERRAMRLDKVRVSKIARMIEGEKK